MKLETPATRRHFWSSFIAVLAVVGSACGQIDGAIESINKAIAALSTESSNWQSTLKGLEKDLMKDGRSTLANEVDTLAQRGIATGSLELRCNADFIGKRMAEGLSRLLSKEEGKEPVPPVPRFCTVTPSVVEKALIDEGRMVSVSFYGYDLFTDNVSDSPVKVYMRRRDGSRQDVSFTRFIQSHYFMSIRVDDPRIDYTGESESLVITHGTQVLSEIAIVSKQPTYLSWCQGTTGPRLAEDSNQTCALTKMSGNFTTLSDSVYTETTNGSWYLNGNATQSQNKVCASATCVGGYPRAGGFKWSVGSPPTRMVPQQGSACFLTNIAGKFQSTKDRIEITVKEDGYYYLEGGSQAVGTAEARCVSNIPNGRKYTTAWSIGMPIQPLGREVDYACFLTKVAGQFGSESDVARVYVQNGSWYLDGSSLAQGAGVSAGAVCIPR